MPRLTFFQLFKRIDTNTIEVLRKIKIGRIEFDQGATITRGTIVAGIDFFKYMDLNAELEVEESNGESVLKKIVYAEN